MIGAILRIVFDHENRRFLPELALRDRFDESAESQIVVGDHGGRRELAHACAGRVIVRQADDLQLRHIAVALEPL